MEGAAPSVEPEPSPDGPRLCPLILTKNGFFLIAGQKLPLPERELGLVSRCSFRPRGSSFYGGSIYPDGSVVR